jgi:hypothetical protein
MNAGNARKDLKYCRRSAKGMKGFVVQNATPINPKKCFQPSAPEHPKAQHL